MSQQLFTPLAKSGEDQSTAIDKTIKELFPSLSPVAGSAGTGSPSSADSSESESGSVFSPASVVVDLMEGVNRFNNTDNAGTLGYDTSHEAVPADTGTVKTESTPLLMKTEAAASVAPLATAKKESAPFLAKTEAASCTTAPVDVKGDSSLWCLDCVRRLFFFGRPY